MSEISFKSLDRTYLKTHVQQFVDMCQRNMQEEYWDEGNFMYELPGKWEYSFIVTDVHETLQGFIIASEKESSIHIHKFVVDSPFQSSGVGGKMLSRILQQAHKPLTLKVRTDNERGIAFYQRNGFTISGSQKELYTMTRSLS